MSFNCKLDHLAMTNLNLEFNMWKTVYDFSSDTAQRERNWMILPADDRIENKLNQDELLHCFKYVNKLKIQSLSPLLLFYFVFNFAVIN